jgi:hypothetical protein
MGQILLSIITMVNDVITNDFSGMINLKYLTIGLQFIGVLVHNLYSVGFQIYRDMMIDNNIF